jgi:hypothetical protein
MAGKKPLIAFAVLGMLTAGIATPVAAHETRTVEGYTITFGGANEPLITGERMWMEFEIVDNRTGAPVSNQAENLTVSVRTSGSEKTALELGEKHGAPGVYEAPVLFTEPGDHVVHLEGSLEGTEVHTHFETQVHDHADLEYPATEPETTTEGENARSGTERNDGARFGSVGVAVAGLGLVAAIGALLVRTRG